MLRFFTALFLAAAPLPALAFNEDYDDGGRVVRQSTSQAATATGLRLMANAAVRSGQPDGRFVAYLLNLQALPRGLGDAFDVLMTTARTPARLMSPEAYSAALAPLLVEMANTFRASGGDLDEVIAMAQSLAELDKAATAAGLPGIEKIITETFGEGAAGPTMGKFFTALLKLGKDPNPEGATAEEFREMRKARADALITMLTPRLAPYAPLAPAVRDIIVWTGGSFDKSSQAMNLVTDAIRTGRFDEASFAVLRDQLYNHISRGPWDSGTMSDALLAWCTGIPELGRYCADVFREMKYRIKSAVCVAIDCDCDNVVGVIPRIYREECRKYELEARMQCALVQQVVTGCRHPFGPAASPVQ